MSGFSSREVLRVDLINSDTTKAATVPIPIIMAKLVTGSGHSMQKYA